MDKRLKINSGIVLVFYALFYQLFMFLKHDDVFSKIIPFGDDPYDAVGSFAIIVGAMLAFLSIGRALWPRQVNSRSVKEELYLVRTQMCVVLAVALALASNAVAMARHQAMWTAAPERSRLLVVLVGMAVLTFTVGMWILRSSNSFFSGARRDEWARAAVIAFIGMLALAVYPERLIGRTSTHLLTIVVGALILFATMRSMLTALVPYERITGLKTNRGEATSSSARRWTIVCLVGVLIGVLLFVGESGEGSGGASTRQMAFVAAVFAGLSVAGLSIAYAFLASPLGLGRRS